MLYLLLMSPNVPQLNNRNWDKGSERKWRKWSQKKNTTTTRPIDWTWPLNVWSEAGWVDCALSMSMLYVSCLSCRVNQSMCLNHWSTNWSSNKKKEGKRRRRVWIWWRHHKTNCRLSFANLSVKIIVLDWNGDQLNGQWAIKPWFNWEPIDTHTHTIRVPRLVCLYANWMGEIQIGQWAIDWPNLSHTLSLTQMAHAIIIIIIIVVHSTSIESTQSVVHVRVYVRTFKHFFWCSHFYLFSRPFFSL